MAGQYATMKALQSEGVEARRMIVSVLDTRTRPQSGYVDGKFEDADGYFHYPGDVLVSIPGNSGRPEWDINDREAVVMSIEGTPPEIRRGRNPVFTEDGKAISKTEKGKSDIIAWTSFDDWMKTNGLKYNKNGVMIPE